MKGEDFPAVKFEVRTGYTSQTSMPLTTRIIGFSIKSRCQVLHNTSDNLIRVHGSKMYTILRVFSIPPITTVVTWGTTATYSQLVPCVS